MKIQLKSIQIKSFVTELTGMDARAIQGASESVCLSCGVTKEGCQETRCMCQG